MNKFEHLFDQYLIRSANSIIHDPFRTFFLENNFFKEIFNLKKKIDVQDDFLDFYPKWIKSSKLNNFQGIDNFPYRYISLGVTQSIDDFIMYCFQNNRKITTFKGEYPYIREIIKEDMSYIDDKLPDSNYAVMISLPFSGTGDVHPRWEEIINHCNLNKIPIFVDCAFFGTCLDISVKLDYECIDSISFSPTKGLNCGYFRSGILFTKRKNKDCSLDLQTNWHHGIHLHTSMALELMKNFSPDTVPETYRETQITVCKEYGLIPSKTMHLALGDEKWNYFSRDNFVNRIGLKNPIYDLYNHNSFRR